METKFIVHEISLDMVTSIRPLVEKIARHDASLTDQMRRAASSVVLNIAEGNYSQGKNRNARFHTAAGSANETLAALRLAVAWGYLCDAEVLPTLHLLDRIKAMLWSATKR